MLVKFLNIQFSGILLSFLQPFSPRFLLFIWEKPSFFCMEQAHTHTHRNTQVHIAFHSIQRTLQQMCDKTKLVHPQHFFFAAIRVVINIDLVYFLCSVLKLLLQLFQLSLMHLFTMWDVVMYVCSSTNRKWKIFFHWRTIEIYFIRMCWQSLKYLWKASRCLADDDENEHSTLTNTQRERHAHAHQSREYGKVS